MASEDRETPRQHAQRAADPLAALRAGPPPNLIERTRTAIASIPQDARPWAFALAAVVSLAMVGGGVLVFRGASGGGARSPEPGGDAAAVDLPFAGTSVASATSQVVVSLVVHAAGAVVSPGVYELPAGSRVGDLVAAAGGVGPDGDADRLNLAAPLADGERLYVPRHGEDDIPAVANPDQRAEQVTGGTATAAPGPIDLNRATLEQLEQLPGIGPSIGQAIIDHRERNGPFRSVDDLLDVRGVGPARLEELRPLVKV